MKTKDEILSEIRTAYEQILGDRLVGIYVHGSIAFGCFDPRVSDIDFLVVVEEIPSVSAQKALIQTLLDLEPHCPPKGVEMSVVLARHCASFVYPTPYELHFSVTHLSRAQRDLDEYCTNFHGTDKDLAAHITVIRAVGLVLCGRPIAEVFGAVPREAYLDSLRYDMENAIEDIAENPVYVILNLCRIVAYLRHGLVISKKDGGLWGLDHLSEHYHPIIRSALAAYIDHIPYTRHEPSERAFAEEMCTEIFRM